MDRNRETRRASVVSSNGFNRRRYRTNSLRDSPDEDMGLELHESVRLRDRVKKDRDRERDRERDLRDRDLRDRDLRERPNRIINSVKRRRNERLTHNRVDTGDDETSEESVNDDEDDDDEDINTATANNHHHHLRDNSSSFSRNINSNHNNITNISSNNIISSTVTHHLQHGKSYPPPNASSKAFRAPPVWRSGDEVINVSVPRKARSSSTKRSHDWISSSSNNNSGGGEQNLRQASDSPARHGVVSTSNQPPTSPSSSNASIRKKLKPAGNNNIGPKPKPSKTISSNPEELEIEIAEVLYGLKTQPQGPSSSCKKEDVNRSSSDARSRHSSPVSNSTSNNNRSPLTAVAPKRKRPRQVPEDPSYGVQISSVAAKDAYQTSKVEISSPNNVDKTPSEMEGSSVFSPAQGGQPPEPTGQVLVTESRLLASELRDDTSSNLLSKEEIVSPKEKESAVVRGEGVDYEVSTSLPTSKFSKVEIQKEEKYEIDLMAPPPQLRSSPERETVLDSSYVATDQKPVQSAVNVELKPPVVSKENDEDGSEKIREKRRKEAESSSSVKARENNGLRINLQLDLEKSERDESDGGVNAVGNKLPNMSSKAVREDQVLERHGRSTSSMPLPLPMASWPGGFPPMGYVAAPLQGVVSMDGATVTPAPIPPMFSQPRSKRCATHCHIARNIYYQQQFMKMNPFWPRAAGSPLFGPRPTNLNVIPGSDLSIKGLTNAQDKPQNISNAPPINSGIKISPSQTSNTSDSSQRKQQVLIQQALPPHVAPNNLMGPAFIFPVNQQQQAALSARPGNAKSAATAPAPSSSSVPNVSSAQTMPMPFNYPNVGTNEQPQYLAILQNNGYPFPIPPGFRGPAGHPMPVFNGSFYPSQMIPHPSQLQQQQQSSVSHNANASNSSSSSQKHSQQQRDPQSASGNVSFASSQKPSSHNNQQQVNVSRPRQAVDGETNGDETSSRLPPAVNMYGQNFAIHPQNFALMTPSSAAYGVNSNQSDKKTNQTQPQQQQGVVVKGGLESLPPHHGFAMSFGPGIDMSSMVQNHHAMFQNSPDVTRQMMSASAGAQKKNIRVSDDGKSSVGGDALNAANEGERKVKSQASVGQSIAFGRSDFLDSSSYVRSGSRASSASVNAQSIQSQIQQQQFLHLKHQQQQLAAANRGSKGTVTSNGSAFADHLNSSSSTSAAKFPVVQMSISNSPSQSQSQSGQWKGSAGARTSTPPQVVVQSPLGSSSSSTFKGVLQQTSRSQPPVMHGQISFGGSHKPNTAASASQGQGPSAPMMSNSPTTSSMSKGASGSSPRTSVSASTTNSKMSQGSPNLSTTQHPKNSPSSMLQTQKSPSILGNPQLNSSSNSGAKAAQVNSQQQQMMAKNMQHAQQLFFSNPFAQVQSSPSNNTCGAGVYFMNQQKRPDKNQQLMQATTSNGMLSLSTSATTDPAKAIAAATGNGKSGGSLPSQGVFSASQFGAQPSGATLLTGFPYAQPVMASVQTKPSEQKQPAGNDNPHTWQPEKK